MPFRKGKKSNTNSDDDDVSDCSSLSQSVFHTTSFNPFKLFEFGAEKEETEKNSTFVQPGADRNVLEQDHSLPREDTIVTDDFSQNGIEVEAVEFSGSYDTVKNYDDIHKRRNCCSRRMILFLIAFAIIMIASGIVGYLALLKMTYNKSSKSSAAAGLVDEEGAEVVDVNTNSSDDIIDISPNDAAGEDNSANNDAEIDFKKKIDDKQIEDSLWSDSAPRPTPTTLETEVPTTASIPDDMSTTNGPTSSSATSPPVSDQTTPPQEDNDNNENVSESESESETTDAETTDVETTPPPTSDPTPAPTPQQTLPVTDVSTKAVTSEVTDSLWSNNNCPDHSLVVSSNCVEDDFTTAFSTVQYCFATKRDGDWYWIRGTGDDEGNSGYDSWDYTDEMEGQLTLLDLGKGNYEISLVRDSMQPYDVITTHIFTVPECLAQ
jgi:hypothetical protein